MLLRIGVAAPLSLIRERDLQRSAAAPADHLSRGVKDLILVNAEAAPRGIVDWLAAKLAADSPMRQRLVILLATTLAACAPASTYRPPVDLTGVDTARYEIDLSDCKKVAERDRYAPLLVGVIFGAGLGTAAGAAISGVASTGNVGLAESYGAISGTVAGTAFGASQIRGAKKENLFVDQCLRNNGYKIGNPLPAPSSGAPVH